MAYIVIALGVGAVAVDCFKSYACVQRPQWSVGTGSKFIPECGAVRANVGGGTTVDYPTVTDAGDS